MRQAGLRVCVLRTLAILLLFNFHSGPALAKGSLKTSAPVEFRANAFDKEAERALAHLLANLTSEDIATGAVIASPSRYNPDYFYHWTRDAALVMNSVLLVHQNTEQGALRQRLRDHLLSWVDFEARVEANGKPGEPKFYVNGATFEGPWGRPQNDGSAARATTLINLAQALLEEGESAFVREKLYKAELPTRSLIKGNLEYTAHHWREPSFDIWEEVKGQHFYTRMVQYRALSQGAGFADRMGDPEAAQFYREQANELEKVLLGHRNFQKGVIEPTVSAVGGWNHKHASLDVAIVLGSLHASTPNGLFSPSDSWISNSANKLERSFQNIYGLNKDTGLATAIGRYPEDVYDGNGFSGGNPWFIATHAFAEMYCRAADEVAAGGGDDVVAAEKLRAKGISYMSRSLRHVDEEGRMSEQYNRANGFMQGARDLSWSYASYLTAYRACFSDRLFSFQ